jgi:hypothetical protein
MPSLPSAPRLPALSRWAFWSGNLLVGLAVAVVPAFTPFTATRATSSSSPAPRLTQAPATPAAPAVVPVAVPAELQTLLSQLDAAASKRELAAVLQFYGNDFKNSDGLTRATLEKALAKFWEGYETLTYQTQITSYQASRSRGGFSVETTTTITGSRTSGGRKFQLTATIKSRQYITDQKIISQEILAEQNLLRAGEAPPTVQLILPAQVRAGQEYALDAIVQEPLRDSLLLGAAMDEPVTGDAYLRNLPIELELLTAGGLFKLGKAPAQPGDRWISVALIRDSGVTLLTQRLRVVR